MTALARARDAKIAQLTEQVEAHREVLLGLYRTLIQPETADHILASCLPHIAAAEEILGFGEPA